MDAEKRARDEAIAGRAAAAERQRLAERARAQRLINEFIAAMRERGVPPVKLRARVADGRATYRTRHQGWYIRRNKALAVGVNGEFLILDVPASLRSRVSGADVVPSEPPLVIGRGARDGESIDLADLLRLALTESP